VTQIFLKLSHVYNKNLIQLKNNKNNIHISISINNKYIYPALVSIESLLINCNKNRTFITYHILCGPDFSEINIKKLKTLMNRYSLNLELIFYNMGNNFWYLSKRRLTQIAFYRLLLPIFVDINRILHLDLDTLIFKDLSQIYHEDFNENYILGILDYLWQGVDYLGLKSEKYVNSGVLLINLEKIRNDKKYYDLINITNNEYLKNYDQTALNYVLYPKIGIFPNKYVFFNFYDKLDIELYTEILRQKLDVKELVEFYKDPTIIHYCLCSPKIWFLRSEYSKKYSQCEKRNYCKCTKDFDLWYSYANKTDYYEEIVNYFKRKIFKKNY
jgi:lipopolysaccharide biosynthesis glycosyltransferase